MLMGLVLHGAEVYFTPSLIGEAFADIPPQPRAPLLLLVLWIHSWRMPLFFLLAGFFAAMVVERRGRRAFLEDRLVRIFGALVVFMLAFNVIYGRPWGRLDHLWFLWDLTILSALFAVAPGALQRIAPLRWALGGPWRGLVLIPVVFLAGLVARESVWLKIPLWFGEIAWGGLSLVALFFAIGAVLWAERGLLEALARPAVFVAYLALGTAGILVAAEFWEGNSSSLPMLAAQSVGTLACAFGLIGLCQALWRREAGWLRLLVMLAYPVYLLHLHVELSVAHFTMTAGLGPYLGTAINVGVTFALTSAAYLGVIRYTPLDWLIAGRAKSRCRWGAAMG